MISLHEGRDKASLHGTWSYRLEKDEPGESLGLESPTNTDAWRDIAVPGNWYRSEIGEFFGTVWFRKHFTVPAEFAGERLFLRFGAVDYYADVWLNGSYLGFHEGMFNPFEFDVPQLLDRAGDNVLVVKNGAPRDDTEYILGPGPHDNPLSQPYQRHQAKAITQVKGHMIDAMHRPGSFTSFRQDGQTAGIWDSVELVARPALYIDYARIFTKIGMKKDWLGDQLDKVDGTGLVAVDVTIRNTTNQVVKADLRLGIAPYNFDGAPTGERSRNVVLPPGETTVKIVSTVQDAQLWWTWDHGKPNLYTATISVADDSVTQNFGIKEIRHDEPTGQWHLNHKRIFLRGMRYISSQWMSEANPGMWTDDLTKMLDMEINAIRIGSHVEPDGFYTMCDELGLLVWQVFPLHYCVSDSDDMIDRASDMIRDMGQMLVNHASMGMWSVFKEPEIYLLADKPNNYHRLCQILKETLGTIDPTRWIHLGDYREGAQNIMIGGVQADKDLNTHIIQPQIVEFGAQSIPVLETLKTFIPEDKLWPPHWDTWEYNGFFYDNAFKFARIELGNSLEEFIDNYQTYEALVVKEQIEFLRQRKYSPVASMYLYYWSDSCPIMGSGLLDYYRRPYKVYDSMKGVYTRLLISLQRVASPLYVGREKIYTRATSFVAKVFVTNDFPAEVPGTAAWRIVHRGSGVVAASNRWELAVGADSSEQVDQIVWPIPGDAELGEYRVELSFTDADGRALSTNSTDIQVR